MKDDGVYLSHIEDAISSIQEYVAGGKEAFLANKMIQDAVIRNLEIIGEAVKKISPDTRARKEMGDSRLFLAPFFSTFISAMP